MTKPSLLWHDYETWGADPRLDRPAQFAAVRTDEDLNPIGEPIKLLCQPANDFIPHPQACLVTGIRPQDALQEGVPEAEFARCIHEAMSQTATCSLGYNTLRFDDEFTRHLLYRNFYDPYSREYAQGNSRWDLIDVMRAAYALRPQGIEWPLHPDQTPSFRLEDLTAANGIEHGQAHDALADVYATLAMARLLRQAQPKFYQYLFEHRTKYSIQQQIQAHPHKPWVHVSSRYPASRACTSVVLLLGWDKTNKNATFAFDLRQDPRVLLDLSVEAIQAKVFTPQAQLPAGQERIGLKQVHINKCPVLLPVKALDAAACERAQIDMPTCERHWHWLLQQDLVALEAKLQSVFSGKQTFHDQGDPDLMLYSGGFFSAHDKRQMQQIQATPVEALADLTLPFQDIRLPEMLFRYRARNYPQTLSLQEHQTWDQYRWQKFHSEQEASLTLAGFQQRLMQLEAEGINREQALMLQDLMYYVESILPYDLLQDDG